MINSSTVREKLSLSPPTLYEASHCQSLGIFTFPLDPLHHNGSSSTKSLAKVRPTLRILPDTGTETLSLFLSKFHRYVSVCVQVFLLNVSLIDDRCNDCLVDLSKV